MACVSGIEANCGDWDDISQRAAGTLIRSYHCSTIMHRREGLAGRFLHRKSHARWTRLAVGDRRPATARDGGTATLERPEQDARMIQVRHRSYATYSRQPRKEATVTGSCVCSEPPVPGLILLLPWNGLDILPPILQNTRFPTESI